MTTKERLSLRSLRQLGKLFGFKLINTADPAELFSILLKYRGNEAGPSKDKGQAFLAYVIKNFNLSNAQLFQDLFALLMTNEKRGGYFVEFGAANGALHSNSYLLEKQFGWTGILAEPARSWHNELNANRNCKIDTNCVWSKSGEWLEFNETSCPELSAINTFSNRKGEVYLVETISLNDLLEKHGAPYEIDYISIDTEGSELAILSSFDFSKYSIRVLTVEHNFKTERDKIKNLLLLNGYERVFEDFSNWDDWYIKAGSSSIAL